MSTMFGVEFYPTPRELAWKMIEPFMEKGQFPLEDFHILEPSAGKGDIAEAVMSLAGYCMRNEHHRVSCLEIDPNLQAVLREKKFNVIGADFLTWQPQKLFNLILMNPPFSNGVDHLLHAWGILRHGDIVCILNAETIRNPHTEKRMLLKRIIADNGGTIEFIPNAFVSAERKTGVEVAIVRLNKKDSTMFDFSFRNQGGEKALELKLNSEELHLPAARDVIGNLVIEYDAAREAFIEVMRSVSRLTTHTRGVGAGSKEISEAIAFFLEHLPLDAYNHFADELRQRGWNKVFRETKFAEIMSRKVKDDFAKFQQGQGAMDFSVANINMLLESLLANSGNIYQATIEEVFDQFTKYYDENRVHVEGWKTNDAFKVNRRVVIPWAIERGWMANGGFRERWNQHFELTDIDRAMCFISGKKLEQIKKITDTISECADSGVKAKSEFFEIRCFKKGTLHLFFLEEWQWMQFNLVATDRKNWIPGDVKKREEQQIKRLRLTA